VNEKYDPSGEHGPEARPNSEVARQVAELEAERGRLNAESTAVLVEMRSALAAQRERADDFVLTRELETLIDREEELIKRLFSLEEKIFRLLSLGSSESRG
jgi:hypothetical protein